MMDSVPMTREGYNKIKAEIDRLEKTEIEVSVFRRYQELFHIFVFLGILCLVLEILLRYTLFRAIP